jgi:hypothetical protein
MRPFTFLAWCAATAAALAGLACVLTILVDPYRFFGTPSVPGWTSLKPRIYQQVMMAKTYQMERVKPKTLLLGNSRVEIGLDPESSNWPKDAVHVFNSAVAGRGLFVSYLMLREAIAVSTPQVVVVGLDFQDFAESLSPASATPVFSNDEARLLVDRSGNPNHARSLQVWRDCGAVMLTIGAISDSVTTLFDQDPATSPTMTPLGFNPLHEYNLFVRRSGHYELFAQRQLDYERTYRLRHDLDFQNLELLASFRYLQAILRVAAEHHIRVVLYIHPYHSHYLEMLHRLSLWGAFEDWKRALVRFLGLQHPSTKVQLHDFADYNDITMESVPPAGDTDSEMHWYWEAGHYKSTLGNELLAAMFGEHEFGVRLTDVNIEDDLGAIREHRKHFVEHIPDH